jgi:hypothetical protein
MVIDLTFDHAVLVVRELSAAVRDFEALGFSVVPGGVHAGGQTHNALIGLADGTYLELVAATRPSLIIFLKIIRFAKAWNLYSPTRTAMGRRFLGLIAAGSGLGDFAVRTRDLEFTLTEIRARGLSLDDPRSGSRMRPDGQRISWRTAVPSTMDLPFLIQDVTPLDLRLPPESNRLHTNHASGIEAIKVEVADLEHSSARFQSLLGIEIAPAVEKRSNGVRTVLFQLGERTNIELVHSPGSETQASEYLSSRQGRPIELTLAVRGGAGLSLRFERQTGYMLSASI